MPFPSPRLRVMTVNALRVKTLTSTSSDSTYSEDDLTLDPLVALRCDVRVFRCPPLVEVLLRVLDAFLLAARAYLANHIQVTL